MRIINILLFSTITSCTTVTSQNNQAVKKPASIINPPSSTANNSQLPTLSHAQRYKIGHKIWQNESGGKVSGLTHWNDGEQFPSLGIGHFIWYPANYKGKFVESFPKFVHYAVSQKTPNIPEWILTTPVCPWNSKAAFDAAKNGSRLTELRNFLATNVRLQTDFIISSSRAALGKILNAAPASDRRKIQENYAKVASTSNGTYALIDYVNFKGDGTSAAERYNGEGWGLLQVLNNMQPSSNGQSAARAFADSAKFVLLRRVRNSPPARGESRWTAGWNNRCETYAKPL